MIGRCFKFGAAERLQNDLTIGNEKRAGTRFAGPNVGASLHITHDGGMGAREQESLQC
jgi:hypothetical protein